MFVSRIKTTWLNFICMPFLTALLMRLLNAIFTSVMRCFKDFVSLFNFSGIIGRMCFLVSSTICIFCNSAFFFLSLPTIHLYILLSGLMQSILVTERDILTVINLDLESFTNKCPIVANMWRGDTKDFFWLDSSSQVYVMHLLEQFICFPGTFLFHSWALLPWDFLL